MRDQFNGLTPNFGLDLKRGLFNVISTHLQKIVEGYFISIFSTCFSELSNLMQLRDLLTHLHSFLIKNPNKSVQRG